MIGGGGSAMELCALTLISTYIGANIGMFSAIFCHLLFLIFLELVENVFSAILNQNWHFDIIVFLEGSGFVYSISSVVDMLTVGAVVQLIQYNIPMTSNNFTSKGEYYRWVLAVCCAMSSCFVLLVIAISWKVKFGKR